MTWVVGMPGLLNGAAGIADIRITVQNGKHREALEGIGVQKIHEVGPWMALGFAGSIELGFRAVNDLQHYLSPVRDGAVAYPGFVTWHWARRVRRIYNHRLPEEAKRGGLELLLLGASPLRKPFPVITHGYILRSPRFEVETIPQAKASSIGSGSDVPAFVTELESLAASPKDLFEIMKFEVMFTGASLMPLSLALTEAIQNAGERTVSEHLYLCFVRPGAILLGTNDMESLTPEIVASRTMPPVATTLEEFRRYAEQLGIASAEALA